MIVRCELPINGRAHSGTHGIADLKQSLQSRFVWRSVYMVRLRWGWRDRAGAWGTAEQYRTQALASIPHPDPTNVCIPLHQQVWPHTAVCSRWPHCLHQLLTQEVPGGQPPGLLLLLWKLPLGEQPDKNSVLPMLSTLGDEETGRRQDIYARKLLELVLWALLNIWGCGQYTQGMSRFLRTTRLEVTLLSQQLYQKPLLDIHCLCLLPAAACPS